MNIQYNNLDDEWINNFEKNDKLYQDFYKDNIYYVNLRSIYINKNNEIDKIKTESFLLTNLNCISREEILGILKKNLIDNHTKYSLLSILKYNIVLEPDEIENYLINNIEQNYLSLVKNIDEIIFEKSINMFHDLNDLILIFYEHSNKLTTSSLNNTKKIYLHSLNNRKTVKKRYKDSIT